MEQSSSRFPVPHKTLTLDIKGFSKVYLAHDVFAEMLKRKLTGIFVFVTILITTVQGNKTIIVLCSYDDHILVMASQIGSMGTILHARKEEGVSINPTFTVSVILGKRDEPMLVACGRQLIEHMSNSGSSRTLVLSLGLKDHSMETLKTIVSNVVENRLW